MPALAWRRAGAQLQEALHDAVLERMEGHDRQPPARAQRRLGRPEPADGLPELVVDGDPERLKAPRRRVRLARLRPRQLALDHARELQRRLERPRPTRRDDRPRDTPRCPLLAVLEENV